MLNHVACNCWSKKLSLLSLNTRQFRKMRPNLGPNQPPTQWVPGVLSGIKRLKREVNYSSPYSVKVWNEWSNNCTPPLSLYGVDKDNMTFVHTNA